MTTTPAVGHVTSRYGKRTPPRKPDGTYGSAFHRGVDIGGPEGTHVVAPEAGSVTLTGRTSLRGLYVIVDHGRYRTLHQHLDSVTVHRGQRVAEGQQIGVMGTSGGVARHLHTEVHDGTAPIDPTPWYAARGVTLGAARAGAHGTTPAHPTTAGTATASTTSTQVPEEDDMRGYPIRNYNGAIGLVSPDGTLEPIASPGIWEAMKRCGFVDEWHQETDGTVWNALTAHTAQARARDAGIDVAQLVPKLSALLVPAVVAALDDIPAERVEAAVETAMRHVLGALDTPTA